MYSDIIRFMEYTFTALCLCLYPF